MLPFRRAPPSRSLSNNTDSETVSTRTRNHGRNTTTSKTYAHTVRAAILAGLLLSLLTGGNIYREQQSLVASLLLPFSSLDASARDLQQHHQEQRAALFGDSSAFQKQTTIHQNQELLAKQEAEWERLRLVHMAKSPANRAGEWIIPDSTTSHTNKKAHYNISSKLAREFFKNIQNKRTKGHYLRCLNKEVQGHCHSRSLLHTSFTRPGPSRQKFHKDYGKENCCLDNSPGILNATDPFVWKPRQTDLYGILDYNILDDARIMKKVLGHSRLFMIGDSVMRQWYRSMFCEVKFFLQDNQAQEKIQFFQYYRDPLEWDNTTAAIDDFLQQVTAEDYVVFNIGHHFTPYQHMNEYWRKAYARNLKGWIQQFHKLVQEKGMDPRRIIFRTTNSRAFHAKKGDYYSKTAVVGDTEPRALAQWKDYGGFFQGQPHQNLMAMEKMLKEGFSVLDVSPMTLSRADATYDGTHLCLPGVQESWSEMLFYKLAFMEGLLPKASKESRK